MGNKSLSDKCNQEVLFNLDGFFKIKKFDGWSYWLENSHGEGFQINKLRLLGMFMQLFEKEF